MTVKEVLDDLKKNGSEQTRKVLFRHGAREPFYGVLTEHLKKLQKKIKKDHKLALELYDTGISDAMYLAGLIADPLQMTRDDLNHWAEKAYWYMLSEYTIPPVAAATPFGYDLALQWIKSDKEMTASAGWATLSTILAKGSVQKPDMKEIERLLKKIPSVIHKSQNRVRYTMNGFVIAAGACLPELKDMSKEIAAKVGKVHVDMGGTACKVPDALTYIEKARSRRQNIR